MNAYKIKCLERLLELTDDPDERSTVQKRLQAIDTSIDLCKDANLMHQQKAVTNKYLQTKALIEKYNASMIKPPKQVDRGKLKKIEIPGLYSGSTY